MNQWIKKGTWGLIFLFSFSMMVSCFGKFPITSLMYRTNQGIGGSGIGGRLIRTILMWGYFILIGHILFLIDLIILNLIEFWTGSPIVLNDRDPEGNPYEKVSDRVALTLLEGGNILKIDVTEDNGSSHALYAKKEDVGVLYAKAGSEYVAIRVNETIMENGDTKLTIIEPDSVRVMILTKTDREKMEKIIERKVQEHASLTPAVAN